MVEKMDLDNVIVDRMGNVLIKDGLSENRFGRKALELLRI